MRDRPGARELLNGAILADDHGKQVRNGVEQALGHLFGRSGRIDQPHALGLLGGDQAERRLHLVMIFARTPADPVAAVAVPGPRTLAALPRGAARAFGPGKYSPMPNALIAAHRLDAKAARAALIGERAVDEAVGQHPAALLQRRTDRLIDMVRAGRGEQQSLGLGAPARFIASAAAAHGSPRRPRFRPAHASRGT